MTKYVQAVVWPRPGTAELARVPSPEAGPGEVTIDVVLSASNPGTERARFTEQANALIGFPHEPGAGAIGTVRSGRSGFGAGDLVAVRAATHRSVICAQPERLHPVPPGTDPVDAAYWHVALIAMHGLGLAEYQAGEPITIVGAGIIGAAARRVAMARGSRHCRVLALSTAKRWTVRDEPDTEFLVASADGLPNGDGTRTALVIDASGTPAGLTAAIAATADQGRIVLLGSPRALSGPVAVRELHERGLRLVGAHIDTLADDGPYTAEFFALLANGRLRFADLVTSFAPGQAAQLYRQLVEDRSLVAPAVDWSDVAPGMNRSAANGGISVRERGRPLRFGVIGCGDVGAQNAQAIQRAAGAELVACVDRDPALAHSLAAELGARPEPGLAEFLAATDLDAVLIATPHDTHEEMARAVVGAGLHMLLQKPLSADLPSARRIADLTRSAPVVAGLLFPGRYTAAYRAARAALDHDLIGSVAGLVATYLVDKPASYYKSGYSGRAVSDWRLSKARSGGGVIIMNLLHHLDLAQSLLDVDADWVFARTIPSGHSAEIEDIATLVVGYGPAVATFVAAASVPGAPGEHVRLWGSHGQCQVLPCWQLATASEKVVDLRPEPEDPQATAVARFAYAVRTGRQADVTIDHGLSLQAIVTAAYESAASGQVTALAGDVPAPGRRLV